MTLFPTSGLLKKTLGTPMESLPILAIQCAFPLNAAIVRASAVDIVGGFDEAMPGLEDWDLWFRLAHNHVFAYLDAVVAKYRIVHTGVSENRPRQELARLVSHIRLKPVQTSQG